MLGRVRNTKLGTNVSNEILLNSAKCQVTVFTVSELLWEPPPPLPTPPPRLGLNYQTRMTSSKAFNQAIAKTFFNAETFRELLFSESISINADIFRE